MQEKANIPFGYGIIGVARFDVYAKTTVVFFCASLLIFIYFRVEAGFAYFCVMRMRMGSEMSDLSNRRKSFFSFLPPPDFRREKSKRKVKKAKGMEVPRKRTDAFVCATTFIRHISAACKNVNGICGISCVIIQLSKYH